MTIDLQQTPRSAIRALRALAGTGACALALCGATVPVHASQVLGTGIGAVQKSSSTTTAAPRSTTIGSQKSATPQKASASAARK